LHLQNMRFGESDIPNILSTCKRLESLWFFFCDSGEHSVLQIEHATLVELNITNGYFETVELNYLPKLQRISYTDWQYTKNPLVLGFVPRLSNLSLANAYVTSNKTIKISQLLAKVPSISNLHLDFRSEKVIAPSIFVTFSFR
jgi:Leucine-rich repeat (LRR) protein